MHSFFVVSTFLGAGLPSVCLGLVHALEQRGVRVHHYKPIGQHNGPGTLSSFVKPSRINLTTAQQWVAQGQMDQLMELILEDWQELQENADIVVVEGLVPLMDEEYIDAINQEIARALASDIILVAAKQQYSFAELNQRITVSASLFGGLNNPKLIGCIINKIGAPAQQLHPVLNQNASGAIATEDDSVQQTLEQLPILNTRHLRCLGLIPWDPQHIAPRYHDVCNHLQGKIVNEGRQFERRVHHVVFVAQTVTNCIPSLKPGALLVIPGDREDVLVAIALAELNGVPLAGVILTGGLMPSATTLDFCKTAFAKGLPVMSVSADTYMTGQWLASLTNEIPDDDQERINAVRQNFAQSIDVDWLAEQGKIPQDLRLSPPAFKHQLLVRAQRQTARIVLPEGDEPRTLQAAIICAQKKLAHCVLLADPDKIKHLTETLGLQLPDSVEVINPNTIRANYIEPMTVLRGHKGLSAEMAEAQLDDNVVLGTMMLAQGHVDGLVSGAAHTTANTIRPALQLIKTVDDCQLVSSVFFMLLPDQVLVYGDCAVNPDPSAEELADIAIQAGQTAAAFGIDPNIAMISYSTGTSGSGVDVEKVLRATQLAQQKRPDLLIDGPLQYDAAAIDTVAKSKAPGSKVAGHANVFIFPDLNTGNTTYKAVQRSAHVLSIGPVLQGLKKPVNDLSRGASIEDIVYTIAITAIQANPKPSVDH